MGYAGAIETGKTICGALFGGAVFYGFLHGANEPRTPKAKDKNRGRAIDSVRGLFSGFKDKFGDTDCRTLTGCDWSKKEDQKRYFKEKIYEDKCYRYVEYVIADCVSQMSASAQ